METSKSMLNHLMEFKYSNQIIRTIEEDNYVYFCLNDVCKLLEIRDSKQTRNDHVNEKYKKQFLVPDQYGVQQTTVFINEPGLYALIFRSRKEEAIKFQSWIFEEVLPSIRKYGNYKVAKDFLADQVLIEFPSNAANNAYRFKKLMQQKMSYSERFHLLVQYHSSAILDIQMLERFLQSNIRKISDTLNGISNGPEDMDMNYRQETIMPSRV